MGMVVWSWDASCVHCEGSYCHTFTVHTARVPAPHNHCHHNQCRTPCAAVHTLVLLMMGIIMPETCWDKSLIINIRLVASRWLLSLHPTRRIVCFPDLSFVFIYLACFKLISKAGSRERAGRRQLGSLPQKAVLHLWTTCARFFTPACEPMCLSQVLLQVVETKF